MCGIYGSNFDLPKELIENKLDEMARRGPDYSNYIVFENGVVLGHNRLAIIDLDPRSNQPFEYGRITIVFNGEIYNYKELKAGLENRGFSFNTSSDTEVICAAYIEYGEECVQHLNGMFAFVIFDKDRKKLFGARDRLGKKPFYYILKNGSFEFASQLSSLEIGNELHLDRTALTKYLYWNFIPEPFTPFLNVFKLKAGFSFTFDLDLRNFQTRQYWDLPIENTVQFQDYDIAKRELDSLLTDAVKSRMISDVPLGVFLSGGVDSSLIAAIAQKNSDFPIKTFSIKFNEKGFDESFYARKVAEQLKTQHTEIECSYEEGIDLIRNFSNYYDEPFADSSAIPSLLLSKYTKKVVTVALSGDGGDETFLGYNIYDIVNKRKKIFLIPKFIRSILSFIFNMKKGTRFKLMARGLQLNSIEDFYVSYFKGLNKSWIKEEELEIEELAYLYNNKKSLFEAISDFDTKKYMNGDCITKVERASMAFSLEVRSPLMDYRVVEFARKIPTKFKFSRGIKKRILKDVLYMYLPEDLFLRKKAGFGMPLGLWFRTELKDYVTQVLSKKNLILIEDLIDITEFNKIVNEHMSGKWDHTPKIWKVIVLINWLNKKRSN